MPQGAEALKVTADDRTNTIILIGEPGTILMAEEMIKRLDTDQGPLSGDTRIFKLKSNARAEDLASTLERTVATTPLPAGSMPIRIIPDAATNRLVVSAPLDQMNKIETLISTLDSAITEAPTARVFRLQVADARQMINTIREATTRMTPRGQVSSLTMSADARTNTLIVVGPAADIKTAASLVEELDQARPEQALEVRVFHVETSDIQHLAQSLSNLLNKDNSTGGMPPGMPGSSGPNIRIEWDRASSNLIVAAPPAEWPRVEKVLNELKEATVEQIAASTRLVPLKHASAKDMARTLDQIFSRRDRVGLSRVDVSLPVVIAPADQANALLISASKDELEKVCELIKQMDVEGPSDSSQVTMVELSAADAMRVADALRAMLPKPMPGQEPDVQITADPQTNSVLIRASENQRKMLEDMISKLDKPIAQTARQTVVHPLQHASATAMATVLNQLYPQPGQPNFQSNMHMPGNTEVGDGGRVVITPAPAIRPWSSMHRGRRSIASSSWPTAWMPKTAWRAGSCRAATH